MFVAIVTDLLKLIRLNDRASVKGTSKLPILIGHQNIYIIHMASSDYNRAQDDYKSVE